MKGLARRCALAALALSVAARAAAADEAAGWPFPGGAATYVAARLGPVLPRGTFASGVLGVGGAIAGGAWYREVIAVELAVGVAWTSGRLAGAQGGLDGSLLAYGVDASVEVAPWQTRAPYLLAGYGRYSFSFTDRAGGSEVASSLGDYQAPHFGIGYRHRVARSAVALGELRYVLARADVVGTSRDLSAIQLWLGFAYP
jgi:hypothetical protein